MSRLTERDARALAMRARSHGSHRDRDPRDMVAVGVPALVGGILAAVQLGSRSLWLDEGSTFAIASRHGSALWHAIAHDGGNMGAYYLLMHVVIAWFGHAPWVLRLPSVLAEAVTGALVAAVALRLFGAQRRLAAAAGLLTVISLPLVYWGQTARGYAILVTLSVGSFLALLAILQTPQGRRPGRRALLAYVLSTVAAIHVGYDMVLLIPAQLALLLVYRGRARQVIGCLAVVLVLCVPLAVLALERGSGQLFWVTPLSWRIAHQAVLTLLSAGLPPDFHNTPTTVATALASAVAVLVAVLLALRAATPSGLDGRGRPPLVVLIWLLVPSVLSVLAYAAGEPIELPRVTILVMPALALLLAWVLLRPGVRPALGLAGVAVLLALRMLQLVPGYGVSPEPWRAATADVLRSTPPGARACVVFYAQDGRELFDYYLRLMRPSQRNPAPNLRPLLPSLPWSEVRPYVERYSALKLGGGSTIQRVCPRLWLIESHAGQSDGTRRSRQNLARYRHMEEQLRGLYQQVSVHSFGWASTINVRLFRR